MPFFNCRGLLVVFLAGVGVAVDAFTPDARGPSRVFLDTADEKEWEALLPLGVFHGVTTNPSLLQAANEPCTVENVHGLAYKALVEYQVNEFMCQAWGQTAEEMYECGMRLAHPNKRQITVKVPATTEGTKAASMLVESGCRVCLTACHDAKQAVIAASVGAEYVAPYVGRMNDNGIPGVEEVTKMKHIMNGMQSSTRVLAASIRDAQTICELAACSAGMETFTISPDVARQLMIEPITDEAAKIFEEAARALQEAPAMTEAPAQEEPTLPYGSNVNDNVSGGQQQISRTTSVPGTGYDPNAAYAAAANVAENNAPESWKPNGGLGKAPSRQSSSRYASGETITNWFSGNANARQPQLVRQEPVEAEPEATPVEAEEDTNANSNFAEGWKPNGGLGKAPSRQSSSRYASGETITNWFSGNVNARQPQLVRQEPVEAEQEATPATSEAEEDTNANSNFAEGWKPNGGLGKAPSRQSSSRYASGETITNWFSGNVNARQPQLVRQEPVEAEQEATPATSEAEADTDANSSFTEGWKPNGGLGKAPSRQSSSRYASGSTVTQWFSGNTNANAGPGRQLVRQTNQQEEQTTGLSPAGPRVPGTGYDPNAAAAAATATVEPPTNTDTSASASEGWKPNGGAGKAPSRQSSSRYASGATITSWL